MPTFTLKPVSVALVIRELEAGKAVRSAVGRARLHSCTHNIPGLHEGTPFFADIELLTKAELEIEKEALTSLKSGTVTWYIGAQAEIGAFPFSLDVTAYLHEHAFILMWDAIRNGQIDNINIALEIEGHKMDGSSWDLQPGEFQRINDITASASYGYANQ